MTGGIERWTLPVAVKRAVLAHARVSSPEECCGLLVGVSRSVVLATTMRNAAADRRRRYRIDPKEHIAIHRWLRRSAPAMQVVGVYHSHPDSAARPSPTDVADAFYADWLYRSSVA